MKTILDLSPEQLRRAAQIREQITSLEKQMQALLGQTTSPSQSKVGQTKPTGGGGGGMTNAARAKISAAMKARWAARKAGATQTAPAKQATSAKPAATRKRKPMSAAQRAQIAETLKARWAKIKAGKK